MVVRVCQLAFFSSRGHWMTSCIDNRKSQRVNNNNNNTILIKGIIANMHGIARQRLVMTSAIGAIYPTKYIINTISFFRVKKTPAQT